MAKVVLAFGARESEVPVRKPVTLAAAKLGALLVAVSVMQPAMAWTTAVPTLLTLALLQAVSQCPLLSQCACSYCTFLHYSRLQHRRNSTSRWQ